MLTRSDVRSIAEEYREMMTGEDGCYVQPDDDGYPDGPTTIMLSNGYAYLWTDGEVTQRGTVVYQLDTDSALSGHCPVCGGHDDESGGGHDDCDTDDPIDPDEDEGEDDDEDGPGDEDAVVTCDGNRYHASYCGQYIGKYPDPTDAYHALRDRAAYDEYNPQYWFVSDHGNATRTDDHGNHADE